jgi:DNA-binding LytR/AlgR family response regulator
MKKEVLLGARTRVFPNEIIKLEAQQNYTVVLFTDGSSLLSSTNLGILEERLQPCSFFRVNRSTVINLNHLKLLKIRPHTPKGRRKSHRTSANEIVISRRRVAAFEACVNT